MTVRNPIFKVILLKLIQKCSKHKSHGILVRREPLMSGTDHIFTLLFVFVFVVNDAQASFHLMGKSITTQSTLQTFLTYFFTYFKFTICRHYKPRLLSLVFSSFCICGISSNCLLLSSFIFWQNQFYLKQNKIHPLSYIYTSL